MPSQKQLAANRRNAQRSTGPRTPEGKSAASQNALNTGIYAKSMLIRGEKQADLEALIAEFFALHHPAAPDQRALVDTLITNEWLLRRLRAAESQIWERSMSDAAHYSQYHEDSAQGDAFVNYQKTLNVLRRHINTLERSFHRALLDLERLQKTRAAHAQAAPPRAPQPAEPKPRIREMGSFPQIDSPPFPAAPLAVSPPVDASL
jgi:hypothetical protein